MNLIKNTGWFQTDVMEWGDFSPVVDIHSTYLPSFRCNMITDMIADKLQFNFVSIKYDPVLIEIW